MKKSNIFVYIELSKLAESLSTNVLLSKQYLKSQAGYFNVITTKYFSDALSPEWENIMGQLKKDGPKRDEDGKTIAGPVANTIERMSSQDCVNIASRVISLHHKVKLEFD